MLKRINRITKNKEFDRAFKVGQAFYNKNLAIRAVANELPITRLGILVSTKVSKKAVVRNHVKRQIREIIKLELPKLKEGFDLVIIVFNQILDKNFEEIQKMLISDLKNLKLYK